MKAPRIFLDLGAFLFSGLAAFATSNHEYGVNEFDTVIHGISPDGKYAIATHGSGDNYGYTGFQDYLMNNVTGKKIGPLEEISDNLDTGADAFAATWSADSQSVYIVYRISRHEPLQAESYRVAHGRAFPSTFSHIDANMEQVAYWRENCSVALKASPKTFGTPKPPDPADANP